MTPLALDIAIACIILLSTIVAYMRGIIKEMFTIVGLFMAAFIAYKLGHLLVPEFNGVFNVPESGDSPKEDYVLWGLLSPAVAALGSSYGSTFAVVLIVVLLIGRLFAHWVKEAGMEVVDKSLGAAFGFLRGFLVVFVIYIPFNFLIDSDDMPEWAKKSYSVRSFETTFNWLNKELELDKKIEERSEGVVIKFDKIDPDKTGEDEEDSGLVKTLDSVTDSISDGASGITDTLKEAMSFEEEEGDEEEPVVRKRRNRLIETREEKERLDKEEVLQEETTDKNVSSEGVNSEEVANPYEETYGEY